jgi:hypothetical protein
MARRNAEHRSQRVAGVCVMTEDEYEIEYTTVGNDGLSRILEWIGLLGAGGLVYLALVMSKAPHLWL